MSINNPVPISKIGNDYPPPLAGSILAGSIAIDQMAIPLSAGNPHPLDDEPARIIPADRAEPLELAAPVQIAGHGADHPVRIRPI